MKSKTILGLRVKERNDSYRIHQIEQDGRLIEKPFKCTGKDIVEAYNKRVLRIKISNLTFFLEEPSDLIFSAFKLKKYI